MHENDEVIKFIELLSENKLSESEVLQQADKFFNENHQELDTEFAKKIMRNSIGNNFHLIEEYAYKGSGAAQLALGALKLEGKGMLQNISEAIFWLKRSMNSNNPKAGTLLYSIYANGNSVKKNMAKARFFLKHSADLGVSKAQYYYACMLIDGEGGPTDEKTAIEYMYFAAQSNYVDAIEFLVENGFIK